MKTKVNIILRSLLLMGIMFCALLFLEFGARPVSAANKIEVKKSSDTSSKVTFVVSGKDIIAVEPSEFFYYDEDDNDHDISENVKFKKKSNGNWEGTYTCKKGQYGEYMLSVTVIDGEDNIDNINSIFFTYKAAGKVKDTSEVKIAAPAESRGINIDGIGSFKSFFNIDKSGKEIFVKKGEVINIEVLYRSADKKLVNTGNAKLKWGSKTISASKVKAESIKDSDGLYNIGVSFRITTDSDMDGEIVATYSGSKPTSRSLGVKLDSDGTAPKIKIENNYKGKDTKYLKKAVSVPITIEEKNFDPALISVNVNGTAEKVAWSSSDTKHTAKVALKEGENVIEVSGKDKAGNEAGNVKSAKIIVDTKKPTVKIEGYENGTGKGLMNGEVVPYPLNITVADETSISAGQVSVELNRIDVDGVTLIPIDMQSSQNGNTIVYTVDDLAEDGFYTLMINAKDTAGNKPDAKSVKSEGNNPYLVNKGKISGGFTVNRKGSKYTVENEELFSKPLSEIPDLVIYEYNKNEIIGTEIELVDSIGTTKIPANMYSFEEIESDDTEYVHKYKYVISKDNFSEGYYSIQISSKSIAGDNGSLITRTEESSSINKTLIIDKTPPEVVLFEGTTSGDVKVKIRDNNMDINSVKLTINGKEYPIEIDEEESTSTNIVYSAKGLGVNPTNAVITCKDMAGNTTESNEIVVKKTDMLKTVLMFAGLGAAAVVLIVVAIVIVINVKKKK